MIWFYDFYYFWAAAKIVAAGGDCYNHGALASVMYQAGFPLDQLPSPFPYPPWILIFIIPLGYLSFENASHVFLIFSLSAITLSVAAIYQTLTQLKYIDTSIINYLLLVVLFAPFFKIIVWGHAVVICFLGLSLFIYYLQKQRDLASGVALSLTLIKPHVFLIFYLAVFIIIIKQSRFKIAVAGLIAFLTITLIAIILFPVATQSYAEAILKIASVHNHLGASINSFLDIGDYGSLCYWTLFFASFLIVIQSSNQPYFILIGLSLPLSVLVSIYAWSHDFYMLFPMYATLAASYLGRLRPLLTLPTVLLLCFQSLFCTWLDLSPDLNKFTIWFPICIFAGSLIHNRNHLLDSKESNF